jgi:hypothetical protein
MEGAHEKKLFPIFTKGAFALKKSSHVPILEKLICVPLPPPLPPPPPPPTPPSPTKIFDTQQEMFINMPIERSGKFYGIPGGGKTTAIIERYRRFIEKGEIPLFNGFLLVTFSNQAVKDFIDKGKDDTIFNKETVSTFHSIAGKILTNLSKITKTPCKETTLKRVVKDCAIALKELKAEELRKIPFLSEVQCITVDEAQDINSNQYSFIKLLSVLLSVPLVLVGDPNQSIYGFQGGSSRFLLEHPGFCVQSTVNYRSTPEIVDILNAIMPFPLAHGLKMTSSSDGVSQRKRPRLIIGSMKVLLSDIVLRLNRFLARGVEGKTIAVIGPVKKSSVRLGSYTSLSLNDVCKLLKENEVPCLRHYTDSDNDGEEKAKTKSYKSKEKDISNWSKVHLLTIHASKGLEFDEVILINYQLNTQNWKPKSGEQYRSYECIWYVGFSRPKETLTVYHLEDNEIWPCYDEKLQKQGKMYAFTPNGQRVVV